VRPSNKLFQQSNAPRCRPPCPRLSDGRLGGGRAPAVHGLRGQIVAACAVCAPTAAAPSPHHSHPHPHSWTARTSFSAPTPPPAFIRSALLLQFHVSSRPHPRRP
jgi:hypothetical protein